MQPNTFLKQKFVERKSKNASYSIRAYARDLGLSSGRLVDILNDKVPVGPRLAATLADRLKLSEQDSESFVRNAISDKARRREEGHIQRELLDEEFAIIADPIHYDILNLLETKNFRNDSTWIARRLGTSVEKVEAALENLTKLKLVTQSVNGKLKRTNNGITTSEGHIDAAIRQSHISGLHAAIASFEKHSVEERDMSSITMPVNCDKIPEAKEMIRTFRRRLSQFVQAGPKTEVYTLKIQLFPRTEKIQ